ncbi:peptide-methionine (R)-S-oxide reductase MsrB [Aureibacter tunicatorum]|uniref:peptide-methionine (R)-S-oxide reductase n=1 Tax=Aureibacter tunicatorum TaxID=866807 RepID=A0AAE3XPB5_9BACT|nr:peptide-methionine (R)-S-oxide reductase MsrB [Aureibacter tunicatorum]MDR6239565.1 peptide-methionine (R)-S-oxide reductase [Aureibacter tunicatorum]BDD04042.1 peptide-methionine (R)-S-oxide reductase [Aureibacter tunicatorum]
MSEEKNEKRSVEKSEAEWKAQLNPEAYHVLREKGTEGPFTGQYDLFFEEGQYFCKGCGAKLFDSEVKYNSGCGWPAFFDSESDAIERKIDKSHGMVRVEVLCKKCGGHLGHVFNDGPAPTGERFCINSAALQFEAKDEESQQGQ